MSNERSEQPRNSAAQGALQPRRAALQASQHQVQVQQQALECRSACLEAWLKGAGASSRLQRVLPLL